MLLKIGCVLGGLAIAMIIREKTKDWSKVAFRKTTIIGLIACVCAWILYEHILKTWNSGSILVRVASVVLFSYVSVVLGTSVWSIVLFLPKRVWKLVSKLVGK